MLNETEKLNSLMELGIKLNQVHDLDILMEELLTEARRFVNADAGSIYIREEDYLHFTYTQNDTLQRRMGTGEKLIYSTFTIPVNTKTIAGYVASEGRSLNLPDAYIIGPEASYGFGKEFDQQVDYRSRSMLTIPLKAGNGSVIGVLQIINAKDNTGNVVVFSDRDEKIMMLFASIASAALEHAYVSRALLLRMIRMAEIGTPKKQGLMRIGSGRIRLNSMSDGQKDMSFPKRNWNETGTVFVGQPCCMMWEKLRFRTGF